MQFLDKEAEQIALECIGAISTRLEASLAATRRPLPDDDQARIEELTDRLVGMRKIVTDINDAIGAILRLAQEDK